VEQSRVAEAPWKKWGPYLTERQCGTVREDYSESGTAGDYFNDDRAARAPITGARTGSPEYRMISSFFVLRWHCGMAKTRF